MLNPKQQKFAEFVAIGVDHATAYRKAGYVAKSDKVALTAAARLLKLAEVQHILLQLKPAADKKKEAVLDAVIYEDLRERVSRIRVLQTRWQSIEDLKAARAADPLNQDVPGIQSGHLAISIKVVGTGKNARQVKEARADVALIREQREIEKQLAIEKGEWVEKRDVERKVTLADVPTDELKQRRDAMMAKLPPELREALELAKQVIQ